MTKKQKNRNKKGERHSLLKSYFLPTAFRCVKFFFNFLHTEYFNIVLVKHTHRFPCVCLFVWYSSNGTAEIDPWSKFHFPGNLLRLSRKSPATSPPTSFPEDLSVPLAGDGGLPFIQRRKSEVPYIPGEEWNEFIDSFSPLLPAQSPFSVFSFVANSLLKRNRSY